MNFKPQLYHCIHAQVYTDEWHTLETAESLQVARYLGEILMLTTGQCKYYKLSTFRYLIYSSTIAMFHSIPSLR